VVAFAPFRRRAEQRVSARPQVHVPWRPIVLVGLAMVLFYMVDTAAFTWGPQYLDKVFPTPSALVALAVFPYLLASGAVRLSGDALVARYGAVPVLRVGAAVACVGLAVTVFATVWPVAVLGFLVMGGGVAVVAPLSFSAAARIAGEDEPDPVLRHARVDAVIGRFNQFNYVGSLLGAVMTGLVGAGNLRLGFAVPMVLVLGIMPLARAFAR
jgi:MFS family permease